MTKELSKRELQAMDAIYAHGELTVAELQALLPDGPSYSATRILLSRLAEKGLLKARNQKQKYVYSARVSKAAAGRAALRRLVETFYNGSPSSAFSALLGASSESLSEVELAELEALVEEARSKAKRD